MIWKRQSHGAFVELNRTVFSLEVLGRQPADPRERQVGGRRPAPSSDAALLC